MKVLFMSAKGDEGFATDLAMRAQNAGHQVRYWMHAETPIGQGLIDRPREWEPSMDWADLIIMTGNALFPEKLNDYFTKGYPIFGANPKAAELELDRGKGQEILKRYGIETLPYTVVSSPEEAIEFVLKKGKPFAMKPWGGLADKSTTCVPKTLDEALFTILRWKRKGLFKGQFMMQEMVDGLEFGIAAYFGPGGFSRALEESWEHKKFLTGNLGCNTGEMGTVIRHVSKSKLFDEVLAPLEDYLHLVNYIGDISVNCMIADSKPWPLEFTMRCGWPDTCIRQAVIKVDPVEWMADLIYGRDTFKVSTNIVVGVVMTHGHFPQEDKDACQEWKGFPIEGVTSDNEKHIHWQQVMDGKMPIAKGRKWEEIPAMCTAGQYVCVMTGTGDTVELAKKRAYRTVKEISWPSNIMYRLDIGDRLEEHLPQLQKWGYAKDMKYE